MIIDGVVLEEKNMNQRGGEGEKRKERKRGNKS
jgi:hypothetical protein